MYLRSGSLHQNGSQSKCLHPMFPYLSRVRSLHQPRQPRMAGWAYLVINWKRCAGGLKKEEHRPSDSKRPHFSLL